MSGLLILTTTGCGSGGSSSGGSTYYPPEPREAVSNDTTTTSGAWAIGSFCNNVSEGYTVTVNFPGNITHEMTVLGKNSLDNTLHVKGSTGEAYIAPSQISAINGVAGAADCG